VKRRYAIAGMIWSYPDSVDGVGLSD
jgi:hypothetical protein